MPPCHAQEVFSAIPYSPDEALRGELKQEGMDPATIDWIAMDGICASLREKAEEHRQCILQKVRDKRDFQREADSCRRRAAMPQPTLPRSAFGFPLPESNNPWQAHEIQRRQHMAINLAKRIIDDPSILDTSYETCMEKNRWRSPFRWQEGRKPEETEKR